MECLHRELNDTKYLNDVEMLCTCSVCGEKVLYRRQTDGRWYRVRAEEPKMAKMSSRELLALFAEIENEYKPRLTTAEAGMYTQDNWSPSQALLISKAYNAELDFTRQYGRRPTKQFIASFMHY